MFGLELSPELTTALLIVGYVLGVVARIVWPYAVAYLTEPQSFDWGKTKGQIVSALVGLVGSVLSGMLEPGFVESLGTAGFIGAIVAGYGMASIGRDSQKTIGLRGK